jgi:hypothetical protein
VNQYLGIDVLERDPDGRIPRSDSFFREIARVGPVFGRIAVDDHQGVSAAIREFQWVMTNDQDVADFKAFVDLRAGRAIPFWLPSVEADLTLAANASSSDTTIKIVSVGYSLDFIPDTDARAHLCFRSGATLSYMKVLSAVNNLDGTETLTLNGAIGYNMTPSTWMVSFMRYCRLEDDVLAIQFEGRDYATVRVRTRELPHEVALIQ